MRLNYSLAVTGHRPNKISNDLYDVNSTLSKKYISFFKDYITKLSSDKMGHTITCISGMALGVDTLFAIAVLQLQNDGNSDVKLLCAIPCSNHSSKWQSSSVKIYNAILERANKIVNVSDEPYTNFCMQDRNKFMVDHCTKLLAIWDGTSGGTGNCVKYAKSVDKTIDIFHPNII